MTNTVLITGCSSGFGKLIARTFSDNGWNVVATMRSPERDTELGSLPNTIVTRLDVTDLASIDAAIAEATERFGQIDALVNNAGYGGSGLFEQFSPDDIAAMYTTNVFGPMEVMRAVLPKMREQCGGVIVNIASMAGHIGLPGNAVYSSTKHALVGLTEGMALEYAPLGIRVYNVAPGAYPTTGFNSAVDKRLEIGDAQLVSFSKKLRDQINVVGEQMAKQGGDLADPQEVADHVFGRVTEGGPVHTPSGSDAEMLAAMMGQEKRQAFLDQLGTMLVPAA